MPNYTEQDFLNNLNYLNNTKSLMREAIINKGVEVNVEDTFRSYANKIDNIVDVTDPSNVVTGYKFNSISDMNDYTTSANIGDYALVSGKSYVYLSGTGYYLNCTLMPKVIFPNQITTDIFCNGSGGSYVNKFWCNITSTDITITLQKSKIGGTNNFYNFTSNDGITYVFDVDNSADINDFPDYNIVINNYAPEVNYIILGPASVTFNGLYILNNSNVWTPLPTQLNATVGNILNSKTAYVNSSIVTGTAFNTVYTWNTDVNTVNNARNFIDDMQTIIAGINATNESINAYNLFNNYKGHYIPPIRVDNLAYAMNNCTNLVVVNVISNEDTISNAHYAFYNCTNLVCIDGDTTLKLSDATRTFYNCSQLARVPKIEFQDILDTAFYNCKFINTFIDRLDTSRVTHMNAPFYNCDISIQNVMEEFDYSSVKELNRLFYNMPTYYSNYTGPNIELLPNINIKNITSLSGLYYNCYMRYTSNFYTNNVKDISYMYYNSVEISSVPNYNFCSVEDASYAFAYCNNMSGVQSWNLVKLQNAAYMFYNCYNLKSVPAWATRNLTNAYSMFSMCNSLYNVQVFNTSKVNLFVYMFNGCINLLNAPALNTQNAINMYHMFNGCNRLSNVPQYNTPNVINMSATFANCNNLSNTSVQNIINMCLNSNMITYKNLNTTNSYSPFYNTKYTSTYYSNRLTELTSAGWSY